MKLLIQNYSMENYTCQLWTGRILDRLSTLFFELFRGVLASITIFNSRVLGYESWLHDRNSLNKQCRNLDSCVFWPLLTVLNECTQYQNIQSRVNLVFFISKMAVEDYLPLSSFIRHWCFERLRDLNPGWLMKSFLLRKVVRKPGTATEILNREHLNTKSWHKPIRRVSAQKGTRSVSPHNNQPVHNKYFRLRLYFVSSDVIDHLR